MAKAVKIAISLPEDEFSVMEALRKREGMTRSRLVREAFRFWREEQERQSLKRRYVEGYERVPERSGELGAWEKASLDTIAEGEW